MLPTKAPYYLSLRPLLHSREAGRPLDWDEVFGSSAPLHLEIGFGNGEYLARQAAQHPGNHYVGIEERWASIRRGLRRIAQGHAANVRILQEDARVAIDRLFAPRSIAEISNLFPCPWHRDSTARHRLFSTTFLRSACSRLQDTGRLWMVTDYRPLLDWTLEQVQDSGFAAEWKMIPPRFDTKYERKWQAKGQRQFYELVLRKQEHPAVAMNGEVEVKTLRVPAFDAARFEAPKLRGEITLEPKGFVYDPVRCVGMLRVILVEDSLTQTFWVRIARRDEGWVIQPALGCAYFPTAGVQQTLAAIQAAILRQGVSDG